MKHLAKKDQFMFEVIEKMVVWSKVRDGQNCEGRELNSPVLDVVWLFFKITILHRYPRSRKGFSLEQQGDLE